MRRSRTARVATRLAASASAEYDLGMAEYFHRVGDETRGPFDAETIRAMAAGGEIRPEDLIRKGDGRWHPARALKGLQFAPATPTVIEEFPDVERNSRRPDPTPAEDREATGFHLSRIAILAAGILVMASVWLPWLSFGLFSWRGIDTTSGKILLGLGAISLSLAFIGRLALPVPSIARTALAGFAFMELFVLISWTSGIKRSFREADLMWMTESSVMEAIWPGGFLAYFAVLGGVAVWICLPETRVKPTRRRRR